MSKRFAREAKRIAAIGLAAALMTTGIAEPMVVSANPNETDLVEMTTETSKAEQEVSEETSTSQISEESTEIETETATEVMTEASTEVETEEGTTEDVTEEETTEEATTEIEEEPVAMFAAIDGETISLDMTYGLTAGTTYMDGMISVGTDMTYTSGSAEVKSLDGKTVLEVGGYVTNKTNPNVEDGTGALLKFTPEYDGTFNIGGQLGAGKTFYVTEAGGNQVYEYANGDEKLNCAPSQGQLT